MKSKNTFEVNGQTVPWSFFHKLKNKYGLYRAQQIFWMCRNKRNIIGYISSGMKNKWFVINTNELDKNKTTCESWCRNTFDKKIPKPKIRKGSQKVDDIANILGDIL